MVHGKNRIPYRIDRRLTGLAGPDYDATISFGLPFESEDSRYGKYRIEVVRRGSGSLFAAPSPRQVPVPIRDGDFSRFTAKEKSELYLHTILGH